MHFLEQVILVEPGGKTYELPTAKKCSAARATVPMPSACAGVLGGAKIWRDNQESRPEWWGGQGKALGAFWSLWSDGRDEALGEHFLLEM